MVAWAEHAMGERVEADFFAVSLPDLIVLMTTPSTNTASTACWSGRSASWGWVSMIAVNRACESCSP